MSFDATEILCSHFESCFLHNFHYINNRSDLIWLSHFGDSIFSVTFISYSRHLGDILESGRTPIRC
jgi:hypothetical protein